MYKQEKCQSESVEPGWIAVLDLGSNSFHLLVAKQHDGHYDVLEKQRARLQFAAGLDDRGYLTPHVMQKAWQTLEAFHAVLQRYPGVRVRAVGTNTLRKAKNVSTFLSKAESILGHPVAVIAGREEARLIYLGALSQLEDTNKTCLVMDIGGGSSELALGVGKQACMLDSMHMGCVSYTQAYFPNGVLTASRFHQAVLAAKLELASVAHLYRARGWDACYGASGTIQASIQWARRLGHPELTREAMKHLKEQLLLCEQCSDLDALGIASERAQVYPGGFAILWAMVDTLDLDHIRMARGALREGILHEMGLQDGRSMLCTRSVVQLQQRFKVDAQHAVKVSDTARVLRRQANIGLDESRYACLLDWAAMLHTCGMAISYSQYHKHGAYIVRHASMDGFDTTLQRCLAALVRLHRRKFHLASIEELPPPYQEPVKQLAVVLRLACLLEHGRAQNQRLDDVHLSIQGQVVRLQLPGSWLDANPLMALYLEAEQQYLRAANMELLLT